MSSRYRLESYGLFCISAIIRSISSSIIFSSSSYILGAWSIFEGILEGHTSYSALLYFLGLLGSRGSTLSVSMLVYLPFSGTAAGISSGRIDVYRSTDEGRGDSSSSTRMLSKSIMLAAYKTRLISSSKLSFISASIFPTIL